MTLFTKYKTPYHLAIKEGNTEMINLLIAHNVDINVKNNDGNTPLHYAVMYKNMEMIKILIDNGANINAQNNFEYTPLHFAVTNKYLSMEHNDIIEHRKGWVEKNIFIFLMMIAFCCPLVCTLKYHNVVNTVFWSINIINFFCTVIILLSVFTSFMDDDMKIMKYLVENNADVNKKNILGRTPLHIVMMQGSVEKAKYLIKNKADHNVKNIYGYTPLHISMIKGMNIKFDIEN